MLELLKNQLINLIDPGNTLGAFLISLLAGCVCSFFGGMKWKECIMKKNTISVDRIKGTIHQDTDEVSKDDFNTMRKISKNNEINVKEVDGDIWQDTKK